MNENKNNDDKTSGSAKASSKEESSTKPGATAVPAKGGDKSKMKRNDVRLKYATPYARRSELMKKDGYSDTFSRDIAKAISPGAVTVKDNPYSVDKERKKVGSNKYTQDAFVDNVFARILNEEPGATFKRSNENVDSKVKAKSDSTAPGVDKERKKVGSNKYTQDAFVDNVFARILNEEPGATFKRSNENVDSKVKAKSDSTAPGVVAMNNSGPSKWKKKRRNLVTVPTLPTNDLSNDEQNPNVAQSSSCKSYDNVVIDENTQINSEFAAFNSSRKDGDIGNYEIPTATAVNDSRIIQALPDEMVVVKAEVIPLSESCIRVIFMFLKFHHIMFYRLWFHGISNGSLSLLLLS